MSLETASYWFTMSTGFLTLLGVVIGTIAAGIALWQLKEQRKIARAEFLNEYANAFYSNVAVLKILDPKEGDVKLTVYEIDSEILGLLDDLGWHLKNGLIDEKEYHRVFEYYVKILDSDLEKSIYQNSYKDRKKDKNTFRYLSFIGIK